MPSTSRSNSGAEGENGWRHLNRAGQFGRDFHFEQVCQSLIHGFHVLLDDLFALPAVGVTNRFANRFNRLIRRQNLGDGEEAHLQNRVHAAAHAGVARDLIGVDHIKLCALRNELLLNRAREMVPDFILAERAVEQECAAGNQGAEHVVALEEYPLVTGDEIRL